MFVKAGNIKQSLSITRVFTVQNNLSDTIASSFCSRGHVDRTLRMKRGHDDRDKLFRHGETWTLEMLKLSKCAAHMHRISRSDRAMFGLLAFKRVVDPRHSRPPRAIHSNSAMLAEIGNRHSCPGHETSERRRTPFAHRTQGTFAS
jgi:hypothetical protein